MGDRFVFPADLLRGVDQMVGIQAEQHGAMEAVVPGEQPGQHRQGMLTAVFLVGGNQHNVPAGSRTRLGRVSQPEIALGNRMLPGDACPRVCQQAHQRGQPEGQAPPETVTVGPVDGCVNGHENRDSLGR